MEKNNTSYIGCYLCILYTYIYMYKINVDCYIIKSIAQKTGNS